MQTKLLSLAILLLMSISNMVAQERAIVTTNNSDISDNLDLRAVASIFGDSRDLDDFERRLNDPRAQISNLDLNGDNRVDYLRVIETVEGKAHLIIIQSVLGLDKFQDIATVEVETDRYNKVQVQVVGDVYMYGNNYIYEPVFAYTPVIYNSFWVGNYRPYYSSWYWAYYPSFYNAWSPFPIYTYHSHIGSYINYNHYYNYVDYRRCGVAYNNYYNGSRGNAFERQYPTRSFSQRNTGYVNRRELAISRAPETSGVRSSLSNESTINNQTLNLPRPSRTNEVKDTSLPSNYGLGNNESPRIYGNIRSTGSPSTIGTTINTESPRTYGNPIISESTRTYGNSVGTESPRPYGNTRSSESQATYANTGSAEIPRVYGNTRNIGSQRTYGNIRNSENPRTYGNAVKSETSVSYGSSRSYESPTALASQGISQFTQSQRAESTGNTNPREYSQPKRNSQRTEVNSRGNKRS